MRPSFSLGIEEEYQTIDPVTRDLRSHIETEMLAAGKMRLQERVKAEMHTSVVEVGTRVCRNIDEAREDIYDLRRQMIHLLASTSWFWWPEQRIPLRTGARRRSIPIRAITRSSRICSSSRAPTSSSDCTCMWASRTARLPFAS